MSGAFSRRQVLRGLGAAVALPWLPSLARGAEQVAPPHRHLFWHIPVGIFPWAYVPEITGTGWESTPVLAPLERHRNRMTVVSGLKCLDQFPVDPLDPHEVAGGAVLTGEYIRAGRAEGVHGGRSVDQLLADTLGGTTALRSLELTSDGGVPCLPEVGCTYLQHISWDDRRTPRSREASLRRAFERLFGDASTTGDVVAQQRRLSRAQSVLDFVRDATSRVEARLGGEDRLRLASWLDGLREVERRITTADLAECATEGPAAEQALSGQVVSPQLHIEAMHDLMALAIQCDRTRVLSYMSANEASQRVFSDLGLTDTHHWLSHHGEVAWKRDAVASIQGWIFERLAHLVDLLAQRLDSDGLPLLDHTTVVALGGMGDPNTHTHYEIPLVLFGGRDQTGSHLRLPERPHSDLLLTLLRRAGRNDTSFGRESTGPISELL